MNAERAKSKARTLARKQARKLKHEAVVPSTQQRPAQIKAEAKVPRAGRS